MAKTSREFFIAQFATLDANRISSRRIVNIGTAALDIAETAGPLAAEAIKDPHLNDIGKRAARRKALGDLFANNEMSRRDLDDLRRGVDGAMGKLALPALDKTDVVAEMREAEARAIVRSMPQDKRDSIERLPPALAAAVVRAPAELSGVSPTVHNMLRTQLIETAHPQEIAALRAEVQAIEMAEHVLKEADKALVSAAEFAPGEEGVPEANLADCFETDARGSGPKRPGCADRRAPAKAPHRVTPIARRTADPPVRHAARPLLPWRSGFF